MSYNIEFEGGFYGSKRLASIHKRLFSLLSKYGDHRDKEIVFDWMRKVLWWNDVSVNEECIFASLAKALPYVDFDYEADFDYLNGGVSRKHHSIQFSNGELKLSTLWQFDEEDEVDEEWDDGNEEEDDEEWNEEENDDWDEEESWHIAEDLTSLNCLVDKKAGIIEDEILAKKCLKLEKERLSNILACIETETDDAAVLLGRGMIYEFGLAGVKRDLTSAWDCYLKAARTSDRDAMTFVREIFSSESKDDLRELLTSKSISKESYPLFFDLAQQENNAELTAVLLEYKAALE